MEVLKKILFLSAIVFIVVNCFGICFAEENVVVLDSLDDYYEIANEVEDTSDEVTDEDLKDYYNEYKSYLERYYNEYERDIPVTAVVTEAKDIEEKYQISYDYSVSRYKVQSIKAKILEGNHNGEELALEYLISADALDNINLAALHVGDKIFVNLTEDDTGSLVGEISNSWSTVQRINIVLCIGVIAMLLLIIYCGRKGISGSLIVLIVILAATIIIPLFAVEGFGTIGTSILVALLLIISISMVHLGLKMDTLKAIAISTVLSALMIALAIGLSFVTRTVGVLFEYAAIAENVILGNIDFSTMFYMSILVIGAGAIADVVAMCINRINRESADIFNDKVRLCRDVIVSHIILISLVLFVVYVPNHILLLTNKFLEQEIINSETLISEFVRFFAIVIPIIFTAPIISLEFFKFGKKYLNEAKEEPVNNEVSEDELEDE